VDGFAAQAVEIGLPQVCSGVIIANVESTEARGIFTEWVALSSKVGLTHSLKPPGFNP
jgi:hypothetical protein